MATNVNWNGVNYSIPAAGEVGWEALSDFLIALGQTAQTTTFQKFATRIATTSPITVAAATDCVIISDLTVAGAVGVTLPAGVDNQLFVVIDGKGDAHTNNVTITPDGAETIEGAATYVINVARGSAILVFKSGNWSLISAASVRPPAGAVEVDSLTRWSADGSIKDSLAKVNDSGATASTYTTLTFNQTANRAITFPNFSGTLATLAGPETLTNKTMGSTNTLTGATAGSFTNTGTVTLPTASTTLVGRDTTDEGANRLQNKHLDANNVEVVDPTDTTKAINFDASGGATSTATTIASSQTANRTITTPDLAGTVALTAGAQVITDKDIDGGTASNTSRITLPANTTANLGGLTRKAGTVVYDSDTGTFKGDNGTTLNEFSSAATATPTTQGLVTSYSPVIQSSVLSASVDPTTITTTDGYRSVAFNAGASSQTINLPAVADNEGRFLTVVHTGSAHQVEFEAASGEVLNVYGLEATGPTSITVLDTEVKTVTLFCDGAKWYVVSGGAFIKGYPLTSVFTAGTLHLRKIGAVIYGEVTSNTTWGGAGVRRTSGVLVDSELRPGAETVFCGASISGSDVFFAIATGGELVVYTSGATAMPFSVTMCGSYILRG